MVLLCLTTSCPGAEEEMETREVKTFTLVHTAQPGLGPGWYLETSTLGSGSLGHRFGITDLSLIHWGIQGESLCFSGPQIPPLQGEMMMATPVGRGTAHAKVELCASV